MENVHFTGVCVSANSFGVFLCFWQKFGNCKAHVKMKLRVDEQLGGVCPRGGCMGREKL